MNEIIKTVLSMSAISATLALLLSIANTTIANYGEKKLTINDDKELMIEGGDTLLSSLIENEIFIPSACGGKGNCGYCKVKVTEGGGEFLATEAGFVTEAERQDGVRLSCQCKVKDDIKIEIPEHLFNVKQYNCKVASNELLTPTIMHLILDLPAGETIDFKPGQYIQILVPEYENSEEDIYRAYSMAGAPSNNTQIELFVGLVSNGVASTYVHHHLKVGDDFTIIGPFGDFYYMDNEREMIMVATGTGMAPIMSILRHMQENQIDRKCTFFFSSRKKEDLFMMDKLAELERDLPNFKLICSLTGATKADKWEGDTIRVDAMITKYLENGDDKEAYMCGSPRMITSAAESLMAVGVDEALIYYDKFE